MNKKAIQQYFVVLGIGMLVCGIWQGLEWIIDGQIVHRYVDDIIGLTLMASLYFNFKSWTGK
ncbi:hypothetical protein [Clostridium botulinum]|uniref:Uncharacterized protein n=1 Tax=Clostridium botulinum TaxID=1491 RepID=A0A9Q1UW43_CLOBO|nr:hypothetical protein [Clostridium botulinum]EDS76155.1 conserved hypothetical protein [Clostridium botulinum C str. Eklund]AEB77278.1 hypothetical protein CbC4_4078 [Clostridium botulinum BKT015925]KEH96275.1 hypothetical protein Y848_13385 [Clostridium botulinum C/D str. Sp77]KEH96483.1 hypothetical protein Z953_p0057 [Clostridium botulinum D str. 16868]KOA75712.1 hypothetical protein ADU78_07245 [Clostridium botulinum]